MITECCTLYINTRARVIHTLVCAWYVLSAEKCAYQTRTKGCAVRIIHCRWNIFLSFAVERLWIIHSPFRKSFFSTFSANITMWKKRTPGINAMYTNYPEVLSATILVIINAIKEMKTMVKNYRASQDVCDRAYLVGRIAHGHR